MTSLTEILPWVASLQSHPDGLFVSWIRRGFREDLWIGFAYGKVECRPARRNMR